MAEILILTFSQTGSTEKIASAIEKGLTLSGHRVTREQISKGNPINTAPYDVVAIGSPVYFYSLPSIVSRFMKNLRNSGSQKGFSFITYGTFNGKALNQLRKGLKKKGIPDLGSFSSRGSDKFHGYMKRGYLFSADSPTEIELQSAEDFGNLIGRKIEEGKESDAPYDPPSPLIYRLESFSTSRIFVTSFYSHFFRASKKSCIGCEICLKKCPTGNISMRKELPRWGTDCMLCLSCQLLCPKEAVSTPLDWPVFSLFINYNIRSSVKKGIPCRKVELRRGKTILL